MNTFARPDSLHRLVKQALDSGAASTVAEAEALFRGYRVGFSIDAAQASDGAEQAALLTGVALARRVFLGGVTVAGDLAVPLKVPLPLGATLREAVERLGGQVVAEIADTVPRIFVGGGPRPRGDGFRVRTAFTGWRGGVLPAHSAYPETGEQPMALAPMLSAALAVSEAFFHVQGETPIAGRRPVGLCLWHPGGPDWPGPSSSGPVLRILPSRLWLIGLGHLGQAYLWALSLLPYLKPSDVELVLQDTDKITESTESTSILSEGHLVGLKKTRAVAEWVERRGFTTALCERLFDASFRRAETDPAIALCGIDNAVGRIALDGAGFPFLVEAGLGRGHRDFRNIRVHTLPADRPASQIWKVAGSTQNDPANMPAYKKILDSGELDECGVTLLAGKAVGAPFVGAVAACLVIAEVLRLLHDGPIHQLLDLDLRSPDHRMTLPQTRDFSALNPGFTSATRIGGV